jgi:hypothetical protein
LQSAKFPGGSSGTSGHIDDLVDRFFLTTASNKTPAVITSLAPIHQL